MSADIQSMIRSTVGSTDESASPASRNEQSRTLPRAIPTRLTVGSASTMPSTPHSTGMSRQDPNLGDTRSRNKSNLSDTTVDSYSHSEQITEIEAMNEEDETVPPHVDGANKIPQPGEPLPPQQQPALDTPPNVSAPKIPQPGEPLPPQQQPVETQPNLATTKDQITVVLTGKSGAGKSTLVNSIFGVKTDTKMRANPGTKKLKTYPVSSHGVTINIIDTVGFGPSKKKKQLQKIWKHTKGKADLVIYCLPIGPGFRFHDSNPDIMKTLTEVFGDELWRHCMVVLTFSNLAWDRIKLTQADKEAAINEYKAYIGEYVENFKRELKKLRVQNVKITTPFDPQPDLHGNNAANEISVIPAGFMPDDKVLAGVEYTVTKRAVDFTDLASATQDPSVPYLDSQVATIVDERPAVTTSNWTSILVFLILTRCKPQSRSALLQFWYGRERFARALKDQGVQLALGGAATGGVVGGAVGAGAGAVMGAAGGPIGIPIGVAIGIVTGVLAGTVIAGGGTAGITAAAARKLGKEKVKPKKDRKETEAKITRHSHNHIMM